MALVFNDLIKGVIAFGRDPRKYPVLLVSRLSAIPDIKNKQIVFRGMVSSEETGNREAYVVTVLFDNVLFYKHEKENTFPVNTSEGKIFVSKPSLAKNYVKIKCTCPDFRFTWEKENYDRGALIGHWRKYVRKTRNMKPRNPNHIYGYCKHVHSFIFSLVKFGLVLPR